MPEKIHTYRVRRSQGKWFVKVFEGWTVKTSDLVDEYGPFAHIDEANKQAFELNIADGDKGKEHADHRGKATKVS
jgi:hypothetical protein